MSKLTMMSLGLACGSSEGLVREREREREIAHVRDYNTRGKENIMSFYVIGHVSTSKM
jgi:hypothetical protein